jgi:hypothetical protein
MPVWQIARDEYNKANPTNQVAFLFINPKDSSDQVAEFLKDNDLSLPIRFDYGGEVANAYGISGIPTTLFINRSGVVVFEQEGSFPDVISIENQLQQSFGSSSSVTAKPPITSYPSESVPEQNQQLSNPTWGQLVNFLEEDDTDRHPYVYPAFVCEDFAKMLQDHATQAGLRCAILHVQLSGYPDWFGYGIPSNTGHACNAFQTTDRGLVYVDDTGMPSGHLPPGGADKIVDIQVGHHYIPYSLFPAAGWSSQWDDMGQVMAIGTAKWNGK